MSYNGQLELGLLADYDAIPDLDELAGYFEDSLAELLEAAQAAKGPARDRAQASRASDA